MTGVDVRATSSGLEIAGKREILLCASVFSFRIPRGEWRSRLEKVRSTGYTAVDLYIPWNFHELLPGEWDFEGDRDVAAFLDLADELGLYVVARPGPYICSEWDGGGLPAWLTLEPELRIRQAEPRYLAHVAKWFDRILPLIASRQHGAGGAVVAVQLENELDFFDTDDRAGYIGALRDLAIVHGIAVPLIACAGQGDLGGASGLARGVLPSVNFYPSDDSGAIEPEVRYYSDLLAHDGLPLFVTETNRAHRTLRRLLVSGATLIAPYLQASGFNHGYTPSVGNWGSPGGFMSHDYDFGGFMSPVGGERPEIADARILSGLVRTLGSRLTNGTAGPANADAFTITAPTSESPSCLSLEGGGEILGIPNLSAENARATLPACSELPEISFEVPARSCALVLREVPLPEIGNDVILALATADLIRAQEGRVEFTSSVPSFIALRNPSHAVTAPGATARAALHQFDELVLIAANAPQPGDPIEIGCGETMVVVRHPDDVGPGPMPETKTACLRSAQRLPLAITGSVSTHTAPPAAESVGVYRGRVRYSTSLDSHREILIAGAGDIVDVALDGQALPSIARFGATECVRTGGARELEVTVETWGHSNFDDARLPGLRIGSTRGLGRIFSVEATMDVGSLWQVEGHWAGQPAPLREVGGWSSTRIGTMVTYRRSLPVDGTHEYALGFDITTGAIRVEVDGRPRTVHAEDPWLLLDPGEGRVVTVRAQHVPDAIRGARLMMLKPVRHWKVEAQPDSELVAAAFGSGPGTAMVLPASFLPGEEALLDMPVPAGGLSLRFIGTQVRLSVFAAGRLLGRVWLGDPQSPPFTGGAPDRIWLPASWNTGSIRIMVHATQGTEVPRLSSVAAEEVPE